MEPATADTPQVNGDGGSSLPEAHPTHRLRDVKIGHYGVQFLVSSKDYLYDVEQMEGGDGAWQAIGVWEDLTIQEAIRTLRQRQSDPEPARKAGNMPGFGNVYGTGKKLGENL